MNQIPDQLILTSKIGHKVMNNRVLTENMTEKLLFGLK